MVSITDFVNKYLGGAANAVTSVLDTIVFMLFIYEEALQTALFAAKTALDNKDYDSAQEIVDFILVSILPRAYTFVDTWGKLVPYAQTPFRLFYDAAKKAAEEYNNAIPRIGTENGTVRIYANKPDVEIYIDGEFKGYADETEGLLIELPAGEHTLEAKKEGYETAVKTFTLEPKEYLPIKVYLTAAGT